MRGEGPNAEWWCWTTNEPSTFRCRERGHDVRAFRMHSDPDSDPAVQGWQAAIEQAEAGLPTSAKARRQSGELAFADGPDDDAGHGDSWMEGGDR